VYKVVFIFTFFSITFSQAQTKLPRVSKEDSAAVMKVWNKMKEALIKSDTNTLEKISSKIVDCYCGTDSTDQDINKWPAKKFAVQSIKRYFISKKLQEVLRDQNPRISISAYNKTKKPSIFSITYLLYRAGELGPKHEGAGIFFDFIKKGKEYKVYSVWTIP
jgi:hypothetical protein